MKNKFRNFALIALFLLSFTFVFTLNTVNSYALDDVYYLSQYVGKVLNGKVTVSDLFKDINNYILYPKHYTQYQIDLDNGSTEGYRYNEYGERIGYQNGNGGRGIFDIRDVPSNSQPLKLFTTSHVSGGGGSHGGGGGSSRDDALPIVETPTSSPVSVVENNQVYNYVTNEYETINNSYYYTNNYNSYYDINVYETDEYYITYEFNNTYYTVCIAPMSSPTDTEYFNVYYELPDGRSSFNLREEDIHGVVFNYDVIPYERTVTNEDIIGLWHLDGTFYNSIDNSLGHGNSSFVNGMFDGGFQVPWFPSSSFSPQGINVAYLRFNDSLSSDWTLQFKMYVPVSTVPGDFIRLDAIGDGYTTHVATFPFPYTMDCWYDVAIDSLGCIYIDGVYDGSSRLSDYINGCIEVYSGFVALKHTSSNIYYQSPSGDYYDLTYGIGVVFDEVKLTNSLLYSSLDIEPTFFRYKSAVGSISWPNGISSYVPLTCSYSDGLNTVNVPSTLASSTLYYIAFSLDDFEQLSFTCYNSAVYFTDSLGLRPPPYGAPNNQVYTTPNGSYSFDEEFLSSYNYCCVVFFNSYGSNPSFSFKLSTAYSLTTSSFDVRREPWDLNFVYTVPSLPTVEVITREEIDFNYVIPQGESDFYFKITSENPSRWIPISGTDTNGYEFKIFGTSLGGGAYLPLSEDYFSLNEFYRVHFNFSGRSLTYTLFLGDDIVKSSSYSYSYDASVFFMPIEMDEFVLYQDVIENVPLSSTIALQSPVAINRWQIGGVRSSEPLVGDVFISLYNNRPSSISQYYNGIWNVIRGAVWYGGKWEDLTSFDFSRMMIISDSDGYSSGNTYNYYYYDSSIINNDYDIDITQIDNNYFEDTKDFIFSLPELLLIVPTLISSVSWLGGLGALLLAGFTVLIGLIIYKLVWR